MSSTNYNEANHQTTFGDKTLTYDNNGNLTSIVDASGTTLYTWNARNQLTGISGPNVSASFVYDGLSRREKKTINGNLTEFLYDGINPVQETSGATVLANMLTGLGIDEYFSRTDVPAAMTSHFFPDALGSAIASADAAGTVQTEYTYEPFGRTTVTGTSNTNPFQFTGRENDGTGLYYYRNRYYHPQLQRFISEDPIEFAGGDINLFAYVGSNPLVYIDPTGLDHADRLGRCRTLRGCVDARGEPKPPPPPKSKSDDPQANSSPANPKPFDIGDLYKTFIHPLDSLLPAAAGAGVGGILVYSGGYLIYSSPLGGPIGGPIIAGIGGVTIAGGVVVAVGGGYITYHLLFP